MADKNVRTTGPANTVFEKILKIGIRPGALVMAPGGVENSAFAFGASPGVGLFAFVIDAIRENRAVLVVVHVVDVGFIPGFNGVEPFEDFMIGVGVALFECPGAVGFEACAGE